jgi:hypothetical protein
MKGSITFKFGGESYGGGVRISQEGELDSGDLEVVVALINQEFMLKRLVELGEIRPSSWDPTGREQLLCAWSN